MAEPASTPSTPGVPWVVSVNVGQPKPMPGKSGVSAIDKRAVAGRVDVRPLGLVGDTQSDTENHGGIDQAVYAYAMEDLDDWSDVLERELAAGQFGENLSTRGVDVTGALIGEVWQVGSAVLQVRSPRMPCVVFQNWLAEPRWVRRFTEGGRPGAYLRVLQEGDIGANDQIVIASRPDHDVTIGVVFRALTTDRTLLPRLLTAPELPSGIRELAVRYASQHPS